MAGLWQALQPLEVQTREASSWGPEGPSAAGGGDPEEHRAEGALGAPSQSYFSGHGAEPLLLPPLGNQPCSAARPCRQPRGEAASDGEGISYRAPFLFSMVWFSLPGLLLPPQAVGPQWRPRAVVAVSAEALLLQSCL